MSIGRSLLTQRIVSKDEWQEFKTIGLIFLGIVFPAAILLMTPLPKAAVLWGSFVAAIIIPALMLYWKERRTKRHEKVKWTPLIIEEGKPAKENHHTMNIRHLLVNELRQKDYRNAYDASPIRISLQLPTHTETTLKPIAIQPPSVEFIREIVHSFSNRTTSNFNLTINSQSIAQNTVSIYPNTELLIYDRVQTLAISSIGFQSR
jgi:hypothetical protein